MVSRRLSLTLPLALLLLLGGLSGRGRALPPGDPGPFWPLRQAHLGQAYQDALPRGASYALRSGRLPQGLTLDLGGALRGVPAETGSFALVVDALEPGGARYPVRLALTVRRADEGDLPAAGPDYGARGPLPVRVEELRADVRSTFDGVRLRTAVRLIRPDRIGPWPLLLFHHGRGFDHDDYDDLLGHLASHGVAVASVEDQLSFAGRTFTATERDYDLYRAELGMQSASGVVESVTDWLLARAQDPQDPLYGAFSAENLFFAGHSRGGGAVHASHTRSFLLRLKGLIYLMPFDLRYFAEVRPPGRAPAYAVFDQQPRTPSLIVVAENDGDLTYPIADQLIDRASGPTTQVTLYGGVHNLISDAAPAEGSARISRAAEQRQVADWVLCFIKRWAEGRTDLDRRLYAGGRQTSNEVAVTGWWPSARSLVLEDAQDQDPDRNRVGDNLVLDLRRRERSYYPAVGDLTSLGLKHTLLTPQAPVSIWRLASDAPLDASGHTRLVMRVAQTSAWGWSGLGLWVRLVDDQGRTGFIRVSEPGQGGGLLPSYDGLSRQDRLIDVHVPLSALLPSADPVDLSALTAVDLILAVRDASRADSVVVDQVRLE